MRARAIGLALLLAFAGCGVVPEQSSDRGVCVATFRDYDRARQFNPDPTFDRRTGRYRWDAWVERLRLLLIQNDCLTRPRDMAGIDAAAVAPVAEGGAPLGRPVAVHVGTFTDEATAAAAVALFRAAGLRATSVGDQGLGRRVFAGPVATEGGLAATVDLATRAGFVAPYPSEFFRF
jgi:hypothetical protein